MRPQLIYVNKYVKINLIAQINSLAVQIYKQNFPFQSHETKQICIRIPEKKHVSSYLNNMAAAAFSLEQHTRRTDEKLESITSYPHLYNISVREPIA